MPRDRFWLEPFHADFRFVRVGLSTGLEGSELGNITGGSVERNQDTAIFEQGSIDYVGELDLGTDLLRVYLEASSLWTGPVPAEPEMELETDSAGSLHLRV